MKKKLYLFLFVLFLTGNTNVMFSQGLYSSPVLKVTFDDLQPRHNFHITSDGQYYYTVNGGGTDGQINKYTLDGVLVKKISIDLDMRSIIYNNWDKHFYINGYNKNFYKLTDIETGTYTKVFDSFYKYDQASLAFSEDGRYLYYFYDGTLKKFSFPSGNLVNTYYNLQHGSGNFGGDGAVAVDDKYIYTCDAHGKKFFVYDLSANFIGSYSFSNGDCGMSLSVANGYLFISKDGNYDLGTWYGYQLYDKDDNENLPPEITITQPDISRGFQIIELKKQRIEGYAIDSDGIYEVKINGFDAILKSGGYFYIDLPLAIGDNNVKVTATDTKMMSITKTFNIYRKSSNENNVVDEPKIIEKEKRVALIFGNSNYQGAAHLGVNPVNDANDIAKTLQKLGFRIIVKTDANLNTMNDALRDFGQESRDADVALFYFAGHGMQIDRLNYLLPVGVNIKDKNDVSFEAVSVSTVQQIMETNNAKRLNIIILDACRNNPFRSWSRGGENGLADVNPPSGTLIAFATSPGSIASNGMGRNGLYTGELIKQLLIPQRIEDVFINTRVEVEKKSGGNQSPWELARLRGVYYLKK